MIDDKEPLYIHVMHEKAPLVLTCFIVNPEWDLKNLTGKNILDSSIETQLRLQNGHP